MPALPQRPSSEGRLHPPSYPSSSYEGNQPPHHRSDSYPRPVPVTLQDYPPSYQGYLPPGPPQVHPPQLIPLPPPPQPRHAPRTQSSDPPSSSSAGGASKKRPRSSQPTYSPPAGASDKLHSGPSGPSNPPAVLTREKKQKACANCRRAKLKCIVGEDQSDCIRCQSRKEKCVFYPRAQDEDWQQTMAQDVYTAMTHLSDLSSAVHHLLFHLSSQGSIPPFTTARGAPLDRYEAPDRDLPSMQGWDAEKNKELAPGAGRRRRGARGETEEEERDGERPPPSARCSSFHPQSLGHVPENGTLPYRPSGEWYEGSISLANGPNTSGSPPSVHRSPEQNTTSRLPPVHPAYELDVPHGIPRDAPSTQISPPVAANPHSLPASYTNPTYSGTLIPPGCIPGQDDPRDDVITEGMVNPADAIELINYSHSHLSPFLFGFRLQFGHFPYLPGGPTLITPLILAVHCLLASERIPSLFHYHTPLADAVVTLIMDSPAGSWRTMANVKDDMVTSGKLIEEDWLDPELGIGPEEIVAAAQLSLWISKQAQARVIAGTAFMYARGWIKILSTPAPRATIAETMGMVTQERVATEQEKARVWLLCYLADGISTATEDVPVGPIRDPNPYCQQLINFPLPPDRSQINLNDLVITSHARILNLFNLWQWKACNAGAINASLQDLQRDTASTDVQIEEIRSVVRGIVPHDWISLGCLDLFGLYVRATISSKLVRLNPPARQRAIYVARTMDAGLDMLELCSNWAPGNICNLPQQYLRMITTTAQVVATAVTIASTQDMPTGCLVTPEEVYPVLDQLVQKLTPVGLQEGHNVWVAVNSVRRLADQLKGLCA